MIEDLINLLREKHLRIATAESCTGGMIAAAFTDIAGFVTYSNESKTEMLGVPADLIASAGAVSEEVAARMATGALAHSHADLAVSVTGIAGPGGGSPEKPVGTVWFGITARVGEVSTHLQLFAGDRAAVRTAARDFALSLIRDLV